MKQEKTTDIRGSKILAFISCSMLVFLFSRRPGNSEEEIYKEPKM